MRSVYMSCPTRLAFEPSFAEAMASLARQSEEKNRRLDLTGALLVHENWFIQVLEGKRDRLMPVFLSILSDPRHQDVRIFELTAVRERLFGEWAMHVGHLDALEPRMVWDCVDCFHRHGPMHTNVLMQALTASASRRAA